VLTCEDETHKMRSTLLQLPVRMEWNAWPGLWNAHTSVGNILGSVVAAACLSWGWGWAFVVPGAALAGMGVLIWLFLVVEPEEAGLLKMRDSIVVRHLSSDMHLHGTHTWGSGPGSLSMLRLILMVHHFPAPVSCSRSPSALFPATCLTQGICLLSVLIVMLTQVSCSMSW
jgi:hypothetical protein